MLVSTLLLLLWVLWVQRHRSSSNSNDDDTDPPPPPPVLLSNTSLWAVGADARAPGMRRIPDPPLVTWLPEAAEAVASVWRRVQGFEGGGVGVGVGDGGGDARPTCPRALYVLPYDADVGVTSQVRDVFDAAIVSALSFGRAVVFADDDGSLVDIDGWPPPLARGATTRQSGSSASSRRCPAPRARGRRRCGRCRRSTAAT